VNPSAAPHPETDGEGLRPGPRGDGDHQGEAATAWSAVPAVLLVVSAGLLVAAPAVIGDSYSWVEHSTSESAGQGVDGAWVARTGFMLFGFAVLWLAHIRRPSWGGPGTLAHRLFGISMIAVAAYASRSWLPDAPFDRTEDLLHSVGSFAVGASFIFGVMTVGMRRGRITGRARWFDLAAFITVLVVLSAMTALPDLEGLLQRAMFAVAYLWYGAEALR
jgi:hypothetical protein